MTYDMNTVYLAQYMKQTMVKTKSMWKNTYPLIPYIDLSGKQNQDKKCQV